jgi:hypothetical protein
MTPSIKPRKTPMNKRLILSSVTVAALLLGSWAAYAEYQTTLTARQAWEYKTVWLSTESYRAGGWQKWHEGNQELRPPIDPNAKRVELGNQGWELVAVATTVDTDLNNSDIPITYTDSLTMYFKRPK